eukprot:1160307-Pelagomonas_calceolata.AAC.4
MLPACSHPIPPGVASCRSFATALRHPPPFGVARLLAPRTPLLLVVAVAVPAWDVCGCWVRRRSGQRWWHCCCQPQHVGASGCGQWDWGQGCPG